MEFIELARKRRSIRKYKPKPVPNELIEELLEAARLAPSGCNAQPWRYEIITYRDLIHKLREEEVFWQDFIYDVPLLIIGCAEPSKYSYYTTEGTIEDQIKEGIQPPNAKQRINDLFHEQELVRATRDLAISMTHMVYRAQELGLGTCFVGCFDRKKAKKLLGIDEQLTPVLSLTVGYPNENPKPRWRKFRGELKVYHPSSPQPL